MRHRILIARLEQTLALLKRNAASSKRMKSTMRQVGIGRRPDAPVANGKSKGEPEGAGW
jgi:hypothetical protein